MRGGQKDWKVDGAESSEYKREQGGQAGATGKQKYAGEREWGARNTRAIGCEGRWASTAGKAAGANFGGLAPQPSSHLGHIVQTRKHRGAFCRLESGDGELSCARGPVFSRVSRAGRA